MPTIKNLISKLLISTCIIYHLYIHIYDTQRQAPRFELNSKDNMRKYFGEYPAIQQFLAMCIQQVTFILMGCTIPMLFTTKSIFKILTLLGITLYNILILHSNVIVPNYYVLRDWLAIAGGIVYLISAQTQYKVKKTKKQKKQ